MIFVGDGTGLHISHIGNANITAKEGNLKLNNVLVVPELRKNLFFYWKANFR